MGYQAEVVIMSRYDPNEIDPVKVALGQRLKADNDAQTIKRPKTALRKYALKALDFDKQKGTDK